MRLVALIWQRDRDAENELILIKNPKGIPLGIPVLTSGYTVQPWCKQDKRRTIGCIRFE
jgi:hypothetical protein